VLIAFRLLAKHARDGASHDPGAGKCFGDTAGIGATTEPEPKPPPEEPDEFARRLRWWVLGIVLVKAMPSGGARELAISGAGHRSLQEVPQRRF
jgi:hypothetical protein